MEKKEFRAEAFRTFLQEGLLTRCRANPRYSLRAYARALGVEPSALSKILRNQRTVSSEMFFRLVPRLDLSPKAQRDFFRGGEATPSQERNALSLEEFQVISDWYHYAILDLMHLDNFSSSPRWIARALGITVSEVNLALNRLTRLGLIEKDETGNLKTLPKPQTTTGNAFTADAFKSYQKQVLEKAIRALYEVPIERRDQSSLTMAVSSDRITEAKALIKEFRRKLCQFLEGGDVKDEVYHLAVSLYPVTHFTGKGSKP